MTVEFISANHAAAKAAENELSAQFAALVEKWSAIVAEVGDDPVALSDRAWDEIWSKVDFATYGITMHQHRSFNGTPWVTAMMGAERLTGPTRRARR